MEWREALWGLAPFAGAVGFFHSSEFLLQCVYNPTEIDSRSLLFSTEYGIAMCCALLEYVAEWVLCPGLKARLGFMRFLGAALVVGGEALRKAAIVTAGRSFTHDIKTRKRSCHHLITSGVYSRFRHPGYLGWFLWSIGTQLLLANPLCTAAFAYVSWKFFAARIPYEEHVLTRFFGQRYIDYARKVPSGLPFIP